MKKILVLFILTAMLITGCTQKSDQDFRPPADSVNDDTASQEDAPESDDPESDDPETGASQADTDYYAAATSFSKSEVEAFARKVKEALLSEDWDALASLVSDPVTVGDTSCSLEEFRDMDLSSGLSDELTEALEQEDCSDMFCNWQGIEMGDGQVWISEVVDADGKGTLKVISINGL